MAGRYRLYLIAVAVVSTILLVYGLHKPNQHGSAPSTIGIWPSSWNQPHVHAPETIGDEELYVPLHAMDEVPVSTLVNGVAGFNYFHNLYLKNGSWIFVSDDAEAAGIPLTKGMRYIMTDVRQGKDGTPGPDMFQIVSTREAPSILGKVAVRREGISLFFNDVDARDKGVVAFLNHYYHFGEMFLGLWRLTVSAGDFELPTRLIYRAHPKGWRDRAGITPWFIHSVMAGCQVEEQTDWDDRQESGLTFLYDRIGIADRWASHGRGTNVRFWNKATADLPALKVPLNWMEPLRDRVVLLAEKAACKVQRKSSHVPVVTYVDRQKTNRRVPDADHQLLLESLQQLDAEGDIELVHAQMEFIDRIDQFCLAARSDIMVGVHGNGLSHQLWMLPGAGVIEIMGDGFTRDYAILAELMSHEYYAIHNDTYLPPDKWTKENGWAVDQGKNFHSSSIPVYGPYVAALVKDMAARRRYGPAPFQW